MDFCLELRSDSVQRQSKAAIFLRSELANGYVHLPLLLQRSQEVDQTIESLSKAEIDLVGHGALSIGAILNAVGYDDTNSLHHNLVDWLVHLTSVKHIDIAAYGLHGLGEMSLPPARAFDTYHFVIRSGLRSNEHPAVTLRSIAFRMLAKTDKTIAKQYIDHDSCREYLLAVEYWQQGDCSQQSKKSLREESDWIRQAREER